ncbi:MAG: gliding motility-associated C-terminal domain-containing protein [Marinilabiliaceae bacterium]
MLRQFTTYFLLLFAGLFVQNVSGQLTADGAWTATTDYATTSSDDPVFCFSPGVQMKIEYDTTEMDANLQSINWYRHDPSDNSWDNFVAGGDDQLILDEPGGYRVVAEDSNGDTYDERCWVYNSQELSEPEVVVEYDDCSEIELSASCDSVPLIFYDPEDGSTGGVKYERSYSWGTIPPGDEPKHGDRVTYSAPYEDMTYVVTVTDRFGHEKEASTDYEAIAVKADFEIEVLKDAPEHERHEDVTRGSAPLEIQFTDESLGDVTAREWTFGDAGKSVDRDPRFVFTEAGKDTVTLRVVNRDSGCDDLSDTLVVVEDSELEVPNVFTPNGDGINDEFRVAFRSLKEFEMVIFNRWGRKVYESNDPEKGWDGTVGGKIGAPGVYFYYIKGEGYNEDEVHKREGAVHLIRDK